MGRRGQELLADEHQETSSLFSDQSQVLLSEQQDSQSSEHRGGFLEDEQWRERELRNEMKHVAGLGELQDVSEVEYRQLRLERVVLIGVWSSLRTTVSQAQESLRELAALAHTAGAVVCDGVLQHRTRPDVATYVGSGKAKELAALVAAHDADTIIVDDDLMPSQRRALEDVARVKVVDRTALILDIFAQHATSKEGKAQIELAQLEYMLPRLRGWGGSLSRQAGGRAAGVNAGIGSRGPGETKIEMDRRAIRTRIAKLRKSIARMSANREVKRGSRSRHQLATVAIVGYTNAGKSSLMNRLTGAGELVGNALFATLDTAVRRTQGAHVGSYAYVDTVGFVRNLPTQLVEAFKSSLEEIEQASVIVHVVDASHENPALQISSVRDVLATLRGVSEIPHVLVLNKIDLVDEATRIRLSNVYSDAILVSCAQGEGIDALKSAVESLLPHPQVQVEAVLPYSCGSLLAQVRAQGIVEHLEYLEHGIALRAYVSHLLAMQILQASEREDVAHVGEVGGSSEGGTLVA